MQTPVAQRGFLLIVAVVLIMVAAVMAAVIVTMTAGSGQAGGGHVESSQALFIAESGLEKAIRQRSLSNSYAGEGPTAMGQGSYTISVFNTDFSGAALPSGQRRIRSTGTIGNATRTVEAIVRPGASMMVYAKESPAGSVGIPFYRQWDSNTSSWMAEGQANSVGTNIYFMVLKFARTRNEAILATQNSDGQIHVQVWNGTTQTWGATTLLADVGAASDVAYRAFDIEYEPQGDRAIIVYKPANGSADPAYRIWDGTGWSGAATINIPTGGEVRWIELAAHPTSDEMALITIDSSAPNPDVYGMHWTGGGVDAWDNMGAPFAAWDGNAADSGVPAMSPSKVIDVAYEQLTGRAMFIWGSSNNGRQRYRTYDGTTATLSAIVNLDITGIPGPDMTGQADWIRLVAQPDSNNLMYVVQDEQRDLFSAFWNGAGWAISRRHDGTTEDVDHRNFDFVFETHPTNAGQGWLVWGTSSGGGRALYRRWTGAVWVPAPPGTASSLAGSNGTALIQLVAHPGSGTVFAGIYEDLISASRDISEVHQVNGVQAWSAYMDVWGGPIAADPVLERIAIAAERRSPIVSWREVFP